MRRSATCSRAPAACPRRSSTSATRSTSRRAIRTWRVSAGVKHRWPGPWLAGATLGYARASLTQATTGDKGHVESLQIGAYGGYRGERLHVIAAALFAQNWIASERFAVLSPTLATASYSGQAYLVGVEAGRKYPVFNAWVQPLAPLVFTHLRQGGFRESGTTLLEIAGDAQSVNALKLSLGVRAWRDFEVFGAKFTPEIRARWVQDLLNERRAITGRFVGDASQTAFTINPPSPRRPRSFSAPASRCTPGQPSNSQSATMPSCAPMQAATRSRPC